MKLGIKSIIIGGVLASTFVACNSSQGNQPEKSEEPKNEVVTPSRIVSTNGTLSEIVVELGLEENLVGVDVTSTYPESLKEKTSVGHNRSMTAEGIVALNPEVVLGVEGSLQPSLVEQLELAGINVMLFKHEFSPKGVTSLIHDISDSLEVEEKGTKIIEQVNHDFAALDSLDSLNVDVLFLYARGAGTLMAFGTDTQAESLIELSGAKNSIKGFDGCKNLTPEALVEANPDVVVMFNSGLRSLNGVDGVLEVPGMMDTDAGKNKAFISFDGLYILGFGPRSGKAILELHEKLKGVNNKVS